jgi:CHAD domain-containing protein
MAQTIVLPVVEANLLRSRLRSLMGLREIFLREVDDKTIHDFRVASRRAREILDYLSPALPEKTRERLMWCARRITKSLGRLRESEVNLALLKQWGEERKLDPVALELMIHDQNAEFQRRFSKAQKRISAKDFVYCEKFISKLKGSRVLPVTISDNVSMRHSEFVSFVWDPVLSDEKLHDLRIRTKRLRYALEIHSRIHKQKLGRFIRRIRNLQDVLGTIHDLYVLAETVHGQIQQWEDSDLHIIPSALKFSHEVILNEKRKLIPQVYPRYSRVIENSPFLSFVPSAQVAG